MQLLTSLKGDVVLSLSQRLSLHFDMEDPGEEKVRAGP